MTGRFPPCPSARALSLQEAAPLPTAAAEAQSLLP